MPGDANTFCSQETDNVLPGNPRRAPPIVLPENNYDSKTFYISQQTSMTILLGINCVDRTVSSLPGIEQIQLGPVLDSCHLFIK